MAIIQTPSSTMFSEYIVPSMPSVAYAVGTSDSDEFDNGIHIYVGVQGDIKIVPELGNEPVTFLNFPAGLVLPVKVKKIFATGTTASNLVGIE